MADDPKLFHAGMVARHKSGGIATIKKRKDDDSGWWLEEGGGLDDRVWADGSWVIIRDWDATTAPLPAVFTTAILRAGGRRVDAEGWSKVCAAVMEPNDVGGWRPKPFDEWPKCAP